MEVHHMTKRSLSFLLALACTGCCAGPDIDARAAITQGLYGEASSVNDTTDLSCSVYRLADREIGLFVAPPTNESNELVEAPIAAAITDEVGFFEIEADPGHYWLATIDGVRESGAPFTHNDAGEVDVAEGVVRIDFTAGPGGGSWSSPGE
jgi:hypothetical protein